MIERFTPFAVLFMLLLAACAWWKRSESKNEPHTTPKSAEEQLPTSSLTIELPKPQLKGSLTLEEALAGRRSQRDFTDEPLTLQEIGQLLWSAQGLSLIHI